VQDIRVLDTLPEKAHAIAANIGNVRVESSVEEALDHQPDVTFVLTPPESHIALATTALEAGSNVFCEKPLSPSIDGLVALEQTILTTRKTFMVGLCFRFHAGVERLYQLVNVEGRVGRPLAIRALMGEHLPTVRPDYRNLIASNSMGVFDLIHDLDLVLWFAGSAPTLVRAVFGTYAGLDLKVPDVAEVILGFGTERVGSVHLDYFQRPRRRYLEVMGLDGTARLDFSSWDTYTIDVFEPDGQRQTQAFNTTRDAMFRDEVGHFLKAVVTQTPVKVGLEEGRRSVEVLEQVLHSRKNTQPQPEATQP